MKVSTENDNNCGFEKITILVDNMPLSYLGHSPTTFPNTEICQYEGNFVTNGSFCTVRLINQP